ncbi:hypothetical protein C356_01143 [Cryptococcus neoformans c45]|nr:hypothetical protein C356_01143 [Cryptococcus neoformans var. grubii c45]
MSDPTSQYNFYYQIPVVDDSRNQVTQVRPPTGPSQHQGALHTPQPSYIPIRPTPILGYPPPPGPSQGFVNPGEIFLSANAGVSQTFTPSTRSVFSDERPAQLSDSNIDESTTFGGPSRFGLPGTQSNVLIDPFLLQPQESQGPLPHPSEPWSFRAEPVRGGPSTDFQSPALDPDVLEDVIEVGEADEMEGQEGEGGGGGNESESSEYIDPSSKAKGKRKARQEAPKENVPKRKRGRPRKNVEQSSARAEEGNPADQKKKRKGNSGKGGWNRRPKACTACNNRHIRCIGGPPCNYCVNRNKTCILDTDSLEKKRTPPLTTSHPFEGPSASASSSSVPLTRHQQSHAEGISAKKKKLSS